MRSRSGRDMTPRGMSDETRTESSHSRQRLRRRLERALVDGQRGRDVLEGLRSLAASPAEDDPDTLFAHRQLAELQLEESPWRAALHLRQLIKAGAADDGVHALMGLCQALLGNFSSAVACYRRAIRKAPQNPWYHHNLGHLLDVGVGEPRQAQEHLRTAHQLEPEEDEITASLAHCIARLGALEEATDLAREALAAAPQSEEHRALLVWIEEGAPERARGDKRGAPERSRGDKLGAPERTRGSKRGAPERRSGNERGARAHVRSERGRADGEPSDDELRALERELRRQEGPGEVATLLLGRMREAGFSREHVRRALALWSDFCALREERRVVKPETYAAAIEYAIAKLDRAPGVTQAAVAERYGIAPGSLSNRYGEIRAALDLIPDDPRYRSALDV